MAMVKVPAENEPLFLAALPSDPRLEIIRMFGGMVAKVNGHVFAGLFGRSAMVLLPEPDRTAALKLEGAAFFNPMGSGARSKKVMLPETVMLDAPALQRWIRRAFDAATRMPPKPALANQSETDREAVKKKPVAKKKPLAKKKLVAKKKPLAKKKRVAKKKPVAK